MKFVFIAVACKILLFPSYHSTDFQVHRNWLAITYSLPPSKWYYEDTSEWTLDYPPLFAYWEYILSIPASYIDPQMLLVENTNYTSTKTLNYLRGSVLLSELLIPLTLWAFDAPAIAYPLIFASPGLIFVDNVHFQYNGFLYAGLVASISFAKREQYLASAVVFSTLINFKHIFLYIAPAYFCFLLAAYCFIQPQPKHPQPKKSSASVTGLPSFFANISGSFSYSRFCKLGIVTLLPFLVSFGPFYNHIPQIITRLFPFKRGLCHAYWAPNFWALYSFADKVLAKVYGIKSESLTRGLIGDTSFTILPDVTPVHTLVLTVIFMLPVLIRAFRRPSYQTFVDSIIGCAFSSFLFGWHVHEKAIVLVLVPFAQTFMQSSHRTRAFYLVSFFGQFSLFPLLFPKRMSVLKVLVMLGYMIWLEDAFPCKGPKIPKLTEMQYCMRQAEQWYLRLSILIFIIGEAYSMTSNTSFLPLMLYSVYNAIGLCYVFLMVTLSR